MAENHAAAQLRHSAAKPPEFLFLFFPSSSLFSFFSFFFSVPCCRTIQTPLQSWPPSTVPSPMPCRSPEPSPCLPLSLLQHKLLPVQHNLYNAKKELSAYTSPVALSPFFPLLPIPIPSRLPPCRFSSPLLHCSSPSTGPEPSHQHLTVLLLLEMTSQDPKMFFPDASSSPHSPLLPPPCQAAAIKPLSHTVPDPRSFPTRADCLSMTHRQQPCRIIFCDIMLSHPPTTVPSHAAALFCWFLLHAGCHLFDCRELDCPKVTFDFKHAGDVDVDKPFHVQRIVEKDKNGSGCDVAKL